MIDEVLVFNNSGVELFAKATSIKATVNPSSKSMEHPLETGATVVDHRIILPISLELSLILATEDFKTVYQQIRDTFLRGDLLIVQTRVDTYTSLIIEKMPHDESAEMYDGIALALSLKEVKFVTPKFSTVKKVKKSKNTKKVAKGQQQPTETPKAKKSSILGSFFK